MENLIVKNCKFHGDLTREHVNKTGIRRGKQQYKCKVCMQIYHFNHYIKNKAKISARIKANIQRDPEKRKIICAASRKKNAFKHREKERIAKKKYHQSPAGRAANKRRKAAIRAALGDAYIKQKLIRQGFEKENITDDLIQLKRTEYMVKRRLRQQQVKEKINETTKFE